MTREDYRRFEPIRMARRPAECHLGKGCWVREPWTLGRSTCCEGCRAFLSTTTSNGRRGDWGPSFKEIEACGGPIP